MTSSEKVRLLEQANIECNNGFPDSRLVVTDTWAQIITPKAKGSASNAVYRSILSSEDVEKKVRTTCDAYRDMKVPFRWLVTPLSKPAEISGWLEKNGLSLLYSATAMLKNSKEAITPIDAKITVKEITLQEADLYVDTFVKCWELSPEIKGEFRDGVLHTLKDEKRRFRGFVAFADNEPVGTAGLILIPSGAYLAAGTVHPDHRGQGIYKALLSHRARLALDLGFEYLLIHAKNHSAAPICLKQGFEPVYEHHVYSKENS
jgi:GNAT superfamily N-acetyltransferase